MGNDGPYRASPEKTLSVRVPRPDFNPPFDPLNVSPRFVGQMLLAFFVLSVGAYIMVSYRSFFEENYFFILVVLIALFGVCVLLSTKFFQLHLTLKRIDDAIVGLKVGTLTTRGTLRVLELNQRYERCFIIWLYPPNGEKIFIGRFPSNQRLQAQKFVAELASLGNYRIDSDLAS